MKTKRKILKINETVEVLVNGAFQRTFVALAILLFVSLSCQAKTLATDTAIRHSKTVNTSPTTFTSNTG